MEKTIHETSFTVERKAITVTLGENHNGRFVRITEELGSRWNKVVVPIGGLAHLVRALEGVIEANSTA